MGEHSRRVILTGVGCALAGLGGCSWIADGDGASETTTRSVSPPSDSAPTTRAGVRDSTATPALDVTIQGETPALMDHAPGIVLGGLPPGGQVTVRSTTGEGEDRWEAEARFEADADGMVRVAEQAPVAGDWDRADGAAPIWAMRPAPSSIAADWPTGPAYEISVAAVVDGTARAAATLERRWVSPDVSTRSIETADLVGFYAEPATESPRPGVVLLHGSAGRMLKGDATMLASHGYPALAVKYFGREAALPDDLIEIPLSYFDGAADWLRRRDAVRDGPLGVLGWSYGGEGALFLAAHADWVGATVAGMPSGLATYGLDNTPVDRSPWSIDGEPVPHLPFPDEVEVNSYTQAYRGYVAGFEQASAAEIESATFPLERSTGPLLLVSGEADTLWPSPRLAEVAVDRLRAAGQADRVTNRAYPKAGHVIPIPHTSTFPAMGGRGVGAAATRAGTARAATDYWHRALETLQAGLG
jgi:dienelactone hydrolase